MPPRRVNLQETPVAITFFWQMRVLATAIISSSVNAFRILPGRLDLGAQSAARVSDRLALIGFFGHPRYANGRSRSCCQSSRIRCRHRPRDAERPFAIRQIRPSG